jgi:hypothetical protein
MRLHEHEPRAGGRGRQLLRDACAAIFLLRRGHEQHVAVREQLAKPREIRCRRQRVFRGVGIGAIEQHQVAQDRHFAVHHLHRARVDAEHLGVQVRPADERWLLGRGALPPGARDFLADERVDQRALAGTGTAQRGDDERRFEPHA